MTTALICGVSGQDGAYLAQSLLARGTRVVGTMRDPGAGDRGNLIALGIADKIEVVALGATDRAGAARLVDQLRPDEIYALWGQSSVGLSFERPAETVDSIVAGTLNLLEAVRLHAPAARLLHAGSGEGFGELHGIAATEESPLRPASPYAAAKAAAQMLVGTYRASYGLHASNAYLFNHESPLRPERFVTRKIVAAACRIARGSDERLRIGRTDIARDWGWAPEYVDALWRMVQRPTPIDLVIATGFCAPLADFIAAAFAAFDLDWRDHVDHDPAFARPTDSSWSGGCPDLAEREIGWRASITMPEVARLLCAAEAARTA